MTAASRAIRVEHLLRELAPQVLGAVMRRFRDFAASEDATQEAMIAAAAQWPRDGIPENPRGWLIQVALRRMTDYIRSEISRRNREAAAAADMPVVVAPAIYSEPQIDPEDTLLLLFMCCHPALPAASAIALTLLSKGTVGEYQLQAAIAAVHDEAARVEDTDWPQILALYGLLMRMSDNPMVALNHAVAAAMVRGPQAGLDLLAPLDDDKRMSGNHRLDAVRAHLLERAGENAAAVALYRAAAAKTTSLPERNYLVMRAARLSEAPR